MDAPAAHCGVDLLALPWLSLAWPNQRLPPSGPDAPPQKRTTLGRLILLLNRLGLREVMRLPASVLVLSLVLPGSLAGQSRADSNAVLHVIELRAEAQRTHDAHAERAIYASDALWINAFGRRRVGPDSIEAFLGRLYADSGYAASRLVRAEVPEVRFIRPDVAVVHEYHEREGQRLPDGSAIPLRWVHTTFVLSKERGRWLVQYLAIGDERERTTPPAP